MIAKNGLADGTTADDVEAAVAEFGAVLNVCLRTDRASGLLEALIGFGSRDAADATVCRLHGAMADVWCADWQLGAG